MARRPNGRQPCVFPLGLALLVLLAITVLFLASEFFDVFVSINYEN